jgi:dienelactone hydrolase
VRRRWKLVGAVVAVVAAAVVGLVWVGRPQLAVSAPLAADRPLTVEVEGLAGGIAVELAVTATDAVGQVWEAVSAAEVRADGELAPVGGDAMTSVTDMRVRGARDRVFVWPDPSSNAEQAVSFTFMLAVDGRVVDSTEVRRAARAKDTEQTELTLDDDGVVGDLWAPAGVSEPGAGVVIVGGSEGGRAGRLTGPLLASHGIPAIGIALFDHPGLPTDLRELPLEQVAAAAGTLAARPETDADRIWLLGVSRGSEAALQTAVAFPGLVHGVIAITPNSAALCSLPDCDAAAWTLAGEPVATTRQAATTEPIDVPDAVIEIERFDGRLVTVCAGWDEVWPSCSFADALVSRRQAAGVAAEDLHLAYDRAGHGVGTLVPYQPGSTALDDRDELARQDLWPRLLEFLARP